MTFPPRGLARLFLSRFRQGHHSLLGLSIQRRSAAGMADSPRPARRKRVWDRAPSEAGGRMCRRAHTAPTANRYRKRSDQIVFLFATAGYLTLREDNVIFECGESAIIAAKAARS
jgi:hypothetical protein